MDLANEAQVSNDQQSPNDNDFLQVKCNWQSDCKRPVRNAVRAKPALPATETHDYKDVISHETCTFLVPENSQSEPCVFDIKVLDGRRINSISLISEAYTLEVFKQFGEYHKTVYADFIDTFSDNTACFASTSISPPCTEASIKFIRTKSKGPGIWVYGIMVYLQEPVYDINNVSMEFLSTQMITSFLSKMRVMDGTKRKEEKDTQSKKSSNVDITQYIDIKFHDMETRLMKKIDDVECRTNQKLDAVLKVLEAQSIK
ncbi:hypothetical protein KM043_001173 [Ampulex compressa]|nr:hypothetical protein KM043_001173 [Ampulex compressa]